MNVAIPDCFRDFLLARMQECGCASVDEYVGRLVEADQERQGQERLEAELSRGLECERIDATADDFDRLRETISNRYADRTA